MNRTNREGLTLTEWRNAARFGTSVTGPTTRTERIAWRMGVDPTEWTTPLGVTLARREAGR